MFEEPKKKSACKAVFLKLLGLREGLMNEPGANDD